MNREIKYRVWDNENKSYNDPYSYAYYAMTQDGGLDFYCHGDHMEEANPGTYIVEQYTGLKDKNGKEIYEGDIMAQTLIDDPFTKKYPIYVVCWDEEFLSWVLKDISGDDGNDTDLHFFIEEWKKCKVIGNIHENKELLEKGEENE